MAFLSLSSAAARARSSLLLCSSSGPVVLAPLLGRRGLRVVFSIHVGLFSSSGFSIFGSNLLLCISQCLFQTGQLVPVLKTGYFLLRKLLLLLQRRKSSFCIGLSLIHIFSCLLQLVNHRGTRYRILGICICLICQLYSFIHDTLLSLDG